VSGDQLDVRGRQAARRVRSVASALALFPLCVFLGITFVYAGIQKLSDPGFLHPGSPTYTGTQLSALAHGTPGAFLPRVFALPDPKPAGVGVAFIEILVGLLVLGGLLTRAAAAAGLGLNLVLFLTNSWIRRPTSWALTSCSCSRGCRSFWLGRRANPQSTGRLTASQRLGSDSSCTQQNGACRSELSRRSRVEPWSPGVLGPPAVLRWC
jgi:uncharacterized membrane protein YphA (DoxX/SURF4 family)